MWRLLELVRYLLFSSCYLETSIAEEVIDEFMSAEGKIIKQMFEF